MNKINYPGLATLILTSLVLGLSCSKSSGTNGYNNTPTGGGATGATITISGMTFTPASKTVAKGTVVKWTNSDTYAHTATSNDGMTFDSGNIAGGSSYSYTANTVGTFDYHCTIHGTAMAGTLTVSP
ncbi:plastocyanin/azurin family copper-binding protein [Flavihumibacter profundi]|uniref:plastocyanin/azurin family copper-binding protein n=1 Tax=Flavihumibacter profundi TaxID=2716883 RepID=UPI001CC57849|nr:plastocyanin/azurin family copper-binding protein [Flavihumibacter profundi]MBZ5856388.1 cupredoxin domain-containing protein [Flavihumibacter profundi]